MKIIYYNYLRSEMAEALFKRNERLDSELESRNVVDSLVRLVGPALFFAHLNSPDEDEQNALCAWLNSNKKNVFIWLSEQSPPKPFPRPDSASRSYSYRYPVGELAKRPDVIEELRNLEPAGFESGEEIIEHVRRLFEDKKSGEQQLSQARAANVEGAVALASPLAAAFEALLWVVLATPDEGGPPWLVGGNELARLQGLVTLAFAAREGSALRLDRDSLLDLASLLRHRIKEELEAPTQLAQALRPEVCVAVGAVGHAWLDNTVCCHRASELERLLARPDDRKWFLQTAAEYLSRCEWIENNFEEQASPRALGATAVAVGPLNERDLKEIHERSMVSNGIREHLASVTRARKALQSALVVLESADGKQGAVGEFLAKANQLRTELHKLPRSIPLP
jgi:hypothetical protein